jgi:hypothetical protein
MVEAHYHVKNISKYILLDMHYIQITTENISPSIKKKTPKVFCFIRL